MEMNYDAYAEAGKISHEALLYAKGMVALGKKYLDVAEAAESYMREKGLEPSFPVNISINEKAAHYTPTAADEAVFTENSVVKIDLGARKGKMLGDCALTVDLSGKHSKLIETTEKALEDAISIVKAGRKVNEIGSTVERLAVKEGFNPIRNLGGHGISKEALHGGVFIPNFDNNDTTELEDGQIIAIEIFLTYGTGYVESSNEVQIFQKSGAATARSEQTRKIADFIDARYSTYPFAMRWLLKEFNSEFAVRRAISELSALGVIEEYPVLVEKTKGIVAQAEAEVIVRKDSCDVITK